MVNSSSFKRNRKSTAGMVMFLHGIELKKWENCFRRNALILGY
jgi:hypothetical protein